MRFPKNNTLPQCALDSQLMKKRGVRRGVTLIDLVICVMVMGTMAAVGVPRFASTVARLRCEAVAKRIASDLNYTRRVAIQSSRLVSITFRITPAGYDMTGVVNPANPSSPYSVNLSDVDGSVTMTGTTFDGGSTLSFNSYGRPMVGAAAMVSGSVTLRSAEHTFTVAVTPATGEAVVQ
jgi:Tfp pilus assembly protein FimT